MGGRLPSECLIGGIRVSTDRQAELYGPDRQRREIEAHAAREGLHIVWWIEEAVSGANHDRAAENEYYDLARRYPRLNFMFSHSNRVGRHVEVIVGIARQIHRMGGTVWIAGLGNLRDPRNWRYFLRDAAEAESDYQNIVSQMVQGKRSKAASGRWPHGSPPWGYRLARDERGRSTLPVPDPEAAPAVRRIYDLAETMGQGRIVQVLTTEGLPSPSGRGWNRTSVGNILHNRRYMGQAVFGGITLFFDPIIPPEQWERVQARRALRKRESGPRTAEPLLWAGHVRCAACGSAMGRDAARTPYGHYVYYRCWRSRRGETLNPCANRRLWPVEAADAEWWAYLIQNITAPELLAELLTPPPPTPSGPPPARVAELEAAITRAWEPFAAGHVSQAVAQSLAAPYVAELERLRAEYAPQPAQPAPDLAGAADALAEALTGAVVMEDRRELLRVLDVRLYVGQEGPERLTVDLPLDSGG